MELKGKQLSLGAKIAAVIFVLLCFAVMLTTKIVIPINDVIKIGTFIALVFSPVDISLWLEKLPSSPRPPLFPLPKSREESDETRAETKD